ncbi:MAG: hypothetical protein U0271_31640 [Polyangiaceae bacterium]
MMIPVQLDSTGRRRERAPRWLLRGHGAALVLLALGNTAASYRATQVPTEGPFRFLYEHPIAELGLLQAYLLMAAIGVVLFAGSFARRFSRFDLLGLGAHLVPLVALVVFHPLVVAFMGPRTVWMSGGIHVGFITLEVIALALALRGGLEGSQTASLRRQPS